MPKHIAVAGNIGAGKSTLAEQIGKYYNWRVELESVEENPYLKDFYDDMKKWSFHLQIHFLNSRFEQTRKLAQLNENIVQDRSIYEDAHIFAKNLHESGLMEKREYNNYFALYSSMIDFIKAPDLLIYLRADIPTLIKRIEMRSRDYESGIRLDYLKNLNHYYEEWISNYNLGKLLIIDVNNIDFVKKQDDLSEILTKVDRELFGMFN
ncbi:deoxynucleoside kinase [Hyphobacterium sp. CCMP332]|nr:deoxynucleoside kinase [Hyphobacterium sp. CCMP332]